MPTLKKFRTKGQNHKSSNEKNDTPLPLESDRKALLGCLIAVLGLIRAKQNLLDIPLEPSKKNLFGGPQVDNNGTRDNSFQILLVKMSTILLVIEEEYSGAYFPIFEDETSDFKEVLNSFLRTFSSYEAAFGCLSLLIFQFLLNSNEESLIIGYDARVRRAFKSLAVEIFVYFDKDTTEHIATQKFLAFEEHISAQLIALSKMQEQKEKKSSKNMSDVQRARSSSQKNFMRGLKIGGAGIVAGTLLAVTGGLAAPAIAAGITAIAGGTIIATTATLLLSSSYAVITIFGVGGGLHVASKMEKRTEGLSEFQILRDDSSDEKLARTIGITGWIKSDINNNFQDPWGMIPRLERLKEFITIHDRQKVASCEAVMQQWKGNEKELWRHLKASYGEDPGPKPKPKILGKELIVFADIMKALSLPVAVETEINPSSDNPTKRPTNSSSPFVMFDDLNISQPNAVSKTNKKFSVWDFHTEYTSELYSVKWETALLTNISKATETLVKEIGSAAATEAIKSTIFASLATAIALPFGIVRAAGMIDAPWTLICERSDEAGIVLARTLIESDGHRPVHLVGYSFGARIILKCLNELVRYQIIYEKQQHEKEVKDSDFEEIENFPSSSKKKSLQRMDKSLKSKVPSAASLKSSNSQIDRSNEEASEKIVFSREPASIIEDVVIMGAPSMFPKSLSSIRKIVAGRMINCYHPNDWTLLTMYRYKRMSSILGSLCGTNPVVGMENYDISQFIEWHAHYGSAIHDILSYVGFDQPRINPSHPMEDNVVDVSAKVKSRTQEFVNNPTILDQEMPSTVSKNN